MKLALIFIILAVSSYAVAQDRGNVMYQSAGPAGAVAFGSFEKGSTAPIKGAPYSATITNESIQTLADGNRIVQTDTGTVARDSQGRTRQDAALPAIGNLSATNAPHLVFIQDPVASNSYTLNLTDKTAWKNLMPPGGEAGGVVTAGGSGAFFMQKTLSGPDMPPVSVPLQPGVVVQKHGVVLQKQLMAEDDPSEVNTESLGSQTMEGVVANGVRTTRTIPAGQMGNERAITIVTEVWTSPDLKTIVSSKRNDPRMGEQTFQLTNIVRAEPDASLFAVPADFKVIDGGPKTIIYRRNQ
jgi:hypothetical protein